MEQELANVESVEIEPDRVEDVEDQESADSQEITTDTEEAVEEPQPPMYTQEQMQAELNRIVKKERERGKRNAEAQYADYLHYPPGGRYRRYRPKTAQYYAFADV